MSGNLALCNEYYNQVESSIFLGYLITELKISSQKKKYFYPLFLKNIICPPQQ